MNINPSAKISPSAKIHPTAVLGPNVEIGDFVEIGPYCIIGYPPEDKKHLSSMQGVVIGDKTIITGLVTIDSGTQRKTIIGAGSFLMKHSHVGHDAWIGKNNTIACGAKIGGWVETGKHCNFALNSTIHQKVQVPKGVMLGMNSTITKKLKLEEFSVYAGTPARFIKTNDVLIERLG